MRRIILSEEQFEAVKFAVEDVAEVYEQFKFDGDNHDEGEQEYETKVRKYGQVLGELAKDQLKD
jgi:hypothetical protein